MNKQRKQLFFICLCHFRVIYLFRRQKIVKQHSSLFKKDEKYLYKISLTVIHTRNIPI